MATQRTARRTVAGSIPDIAGIFGGLGAEISVLEQQLRGHRAQCATPARADSTATSSAAADSTEGEHMTGDDMIEDDDRPSRRPDRLPPPTAASGPAPLPGEPVDTSFAEPTQTPAAQAAGAAPRPDPSSEQETDPAEPPSSAEFSRVAKWTARLHARAGAATARLRTSLQLPRTTSVAA